MTWVKICGTTNLEDALVAVNAGADAVGFVFYDKSPRNISVEAAREIVEKLPEKVEKVGVVVQDAKDDSLDIFFAARLTGLQTYILRDSPGSHRATGVSCLPPRTRFLTAIPMSLLGDQDGIRSLAESFIGAQAKPPNDIPFSEEVVRGYLNTFVLDSGDLRRPGGTGQTFDWVKAVPAAEAMREKGFNLVVAGGLTPENVSEAIEILKPWGVDVASGVEARPGKKDPEKVRAFVRAVREYDRKAGS